MSGINGYFATGSLIGIPAKNVVDFVVTNKAGDVVAKKGDSVGKADGQFTQFKVEMRDIPQFSDDFVFKATVVADPNLPGVKTFVVGSLSYDDDK